MADLKWSLWEPRIERSPRELPLRTKHNSALYSISFNAVREPSFCPLNTLFPGLTILTHFSFCPYFMIYGTRWYDSYEGVEVGLRPSWNMFPRIEHNKSKDGKIDYQKHRTVRILYFYLNSPRFLWVFFFLLFCSLITLLALTGFRPLKSPSLFFHMLLFHKFSLYP